MEKIFVISSVKLKKEIAERVENVFAKKYSEPPQFEYIIDKSILGGLLIIDGDNYYDATVRGQLDSISKSL